MNVSIDLTDARTAATGMGATGRAVSVLACPPPALLFARLGSSGTLAPLREGDSLLAPEVGELFISHGALPHATATVLVSQDATVVRGAGGPLSREVLGLEAIAVPAAPDAAILVAGLETGRNLRVLAGEITPDAAYTLILSDLTDKVFLTATGAAGETFRFGFGDSGRFCAGTLRMVNAGAACNLFGWLLYGVD